MILRLVALLLLTLAALATRAGAHEIRPAYLQIDERAPGHYEVLWKVPTRDGMVQDIRPTFGPGFTLTPLPGASVVGGFVIFRYALTGDAPLPGTTLTIGNLDRTAMDALVNVALLNGTRSSLVLSPRETSVEIPPTLSTWQVMQTYTRLGVEHILGGIDHLAFVAALMLVVRGWPMLLKTVTAFTIAHSITLALATFGYVSLPPPPVEALIALSIMLVAAESIHLRQGRSSLATRWPWIVALAFGLLHGFGFAGALREIGLPQGDVPLALLSFNVGVELGQLMFIAAIIWTVKILLQLVALPRAAPVAAAYGIGVVAMVWLAARLDTMIF